MQEFPPNSAKTKKQTNVPQPEERPKREPVTSAGQIRRKRGLGKKFKSAFIVGNTRSAVDSMVGDVIVPMLKDTLFEAVQSGFRSLIFGESTRGYRGPMPPAYSQQPRINYGQYSTTANRPPEPREISRQSRGRMDFGEVVIPNRFEAEEVLERLYDELSRYESVPVAVLYELTGIKSSHTDFKWGWVSLSGAKVVRLGDGRYMLDLPEPISLER